MRCGTDRRRCLGGIGHAAPKRAANLFTLAATCLLPRTASRDGIHRLYLRYKEPDQDIILAEGIAKLCEDLGGCCALGWAEEGNMFACHLHACSVAEDAALGGRICCLCPPGSGTAPPAYTVPMSTPAWPQRWSRTTL